MRKGDLFFRSSRDAAGNCPRQLDRLSVLDDKTPNLRVNDTATTTRVGVRISVESRSSTHGQSKITRRSVFARGLDPIIPCPLSGSACYAIGLHGPDRRAVCFVSLIAERLSGGPPRLFPTIYRRSGLPLRHPLAPPSTRTPSPRFFVPRATSAGGRHFIFKKQPPSALSYVRPFVRSSSVQARGLVLLSRMVAPWPTLLIARQGGKGTKKRSKRERDEERIGAKTLRDYASHEDAALDKPRENPCFAILLRPKALSSSSQKNEESA